MKSILIVLIIMTVAACSGSESTPGTSPSGETSGTHAVSFEGQPMGSVNFPVSCNATAAGKMERGLALLHHMMYTQADAVFQSAAEADPTCAMSYWGRAMTLIHPMWPDIPSSAEFKRGTELVTRALATGVPTDREEGYIDAVGGYFQDAEQRSEADRLTSFHDGWQRVHERFADDPEAAAFNALSLLAIGDIGVADATECAMSAVAETKKLLEAIPDHPGAQHYTIHAYDYIPPDAWAVEVAQRYGELAPEVPHALHMPTHIFTTLGLWNESIKLNERSAAAAFESGRKGAGLDNHYPHALGYLIYAYLQTGQDTKAGQIVEQVRSVEGPFSQLNRMVVAAHFTGIPVRYVLERHAWQEAAQLELRATKSFPWDEFPQFDALTEYARTIGYARLGNPDEADAALVRLTAALEQAGPQGTASYLIRDDTALALSAAGWVDFVKGDIAGAISKMEVAASRNIDAYLLGPGELLPADEQLADMYMELGRYQDALTTYQGALARLPNRLNSICGMARAAEQLGNRDLIGPYRETLEGILVSEAASRCLEPK